MAQQDGNADPDREKLPDEIAEFANSLDDTYTDWGPETDALRDQKTIAHVSRPRYGSERLFIVSKPGEETPPPTFIDHVENNGYPLLSERTTTEDRWIAVLEPLAHRKARQNTENPATPLVRERGDEGNRLAQLARQVTESIRGFQRSRQEIEFNAEDAYVHPGDTPNMAWKALDRYQTCAATLLGYEAGILDTPDAPEIAAEHLLARPKEAAYARGVIQSMFKNAEIIGEDASLTRTDATDGNEALAESLDIHAAKLVGHARIAHNAIAQFVADQSKLGK